MKYVKGFLSALWSFLKYIHREYGKWREGAAERARDKLEKDKIKWALQADKADAKANLFLSQAKERKAKTALQKANREAGGSGILGNFFRNMTTPDKPTPTNTRKKKVAVRGDDDLSDLFEL